MYALHFKLGASSVFRHADDDLRASAYIATCHTNLPPSVSVLFIVRFSPDIELLQSFCLRVSWGLAPSANVIQDVSLLQQLIVLIWAIYVPTKSI